MLKIVSKEEKKITTYNFGFCIIINNVTSVLYAYKHSHKIKFIQIRNSLI